MRQRLVLNGCTCDGRGRRQVRPLEARRCKIGDTVPNRCRQLRDRLLNLRRVVIRLGFVDLGNPGQGSVRCDGVLRCCDTHFRIAKWDARSASTRVSRSLYSVYIS